MHKQNFQDTKLKKKQKKNKNLFKFEKKTRKKILAIYKTIQDWPCACASMPKTTAVKEIQQLKTEKMELELQLCKTILQLSELQSKYEKIRLAIENGNLLRADSTDIFVFEDLQ